MTVRLHPHAIQRLKERGATQAEVTHTVKHGRRSPAKFGRSKFVHAFAYDRTWLGTRYARKTVEAYAVNEGDAANPDWLVLTVITKFA